MKSEKRDMLKTIRIQFYRELHLCYIVDCNLNKSLGVIIKRDLSVAYLLECEMNCCKCLSFKLFKYISD